MFDVFSSTEFLDLEAAERISDYLAAGVGALGVELWSIYVQLLIGMGRDFKLEGALYMLAGAVGV